MTKIICELGQNHNGSMTLAKDMISAAKDCGADYVKFAKRSPKDCVPEHMWHVMRETPWGVMSYLAYRERLEFGLDQYEVIDAHCKKVGIEWFVSVSDLKSLDDMYQFGERMPFIKIPSAKNTDEKLLLKAAEFANHFGSRVMVSTGMIDDAQVNKISRLLSLDVCKTSPIFFYCVSAYPCPNDQIHLGVIRSYKRNLRGPVGYSGHEVGLQLSLAAVALGADYIERHFTLSRAMWGSDQAASLEPDGMRRLVRDAKIISEATRFELKKVMPCEQDAIRRLRG